MFDEILDPTTYGCDTTELILLHRAFRREFGLLPRQVRRVPLGDTFRAEVVTQHAEELLRSLTQYLFGARDLWTELFAAGVVGPTMHARLAGQHRRLHTVMRETAGVLPNWQVLADSTHRAELASALTELDRRIREHFDDTERDVLPLVRRHVSAQEWATLRELGMSCLPKNRRLLFLARILEDASPSEESDVLSRLSPSRRLEYRLVGSRRRSRDNARLRSGLAVPPQL